MGLEGYFPKLHDMISNYSCQQFTSGVVGKGFFCCGRFADSLRKVRGKLPPQKKFYNCVRKGCGNSAESLRKFHGNLLRKQICCGEIFCYLERHVLGSESHPQMPPKLKLHLDKLVSTISVGFLTHVTGKQAKVRANLSRKSSGKRNVCLAFLLWP